MAIGVLLAVDLFVSLIRNGLSLSAMNRKCCGNPIEIVDVEFNEKNVSK